MKEKIKKVIELTKENAVVIGSVGSCLVCTAWGIYEFTRVRKMERQVNAIHGSLVSHLWIP